LRSHHILVDLTLSISTMNSRIKMSAIQKLRRVDNKIVYNNIHYCLDCGCVIEHSQKHNIYVHGLKLQAPSLRQVTGLTRAPRVFENFKDLMLKKIEKCKEYVFHFQNLSKEKADLFNELFLHRTQNFSQVGEIVKYLKDLMGLFAGIINKLIRQDQSVIADNVLLILSKVIPIISINLPQIAQMNLSLIEPIKYIMSGCKTYVIFNSAKPNFNIEIGQIYGTLLHFIQVLSLQNIEEKYDFYLIKMMLNPYLQVLTNEISAFVSTINDQHLFNKDYHGVMYSDDTEMTKIEDSEVWFDAVEIEKK
jgi:hypothetical protein